VLVTAVDDPDVEGTHLGTITHGISTADPHYPSVTVASVTATITDNDDVARFDGYYTGDYWGTDGTTEPGPVAFNVSGGTIDVTAPMAGSGTVWPSGEALFTSGSVGTATFDGTFEVSTSGHASASGEWQSNEGMFHGEGSASRDDLVAAHRAVDRLQAAAVLTQEALGAVAAEAVARWASAGADERASAALERLSFRIVDLSSARLGSAGPEVIYLDRDAAGHGWFIDPTPQEDEEFTLLAEQGLLAGQDGPAADHMDLLSVVLHELGHVLGLEHFDSLEDLDSLMAETLAVGTRRLPRPSEVDAVFAEALSADLSYRW